MDPPMAQRIQGVQKYPPLNEAGGTLTMNRSERPIHISSGSGVTAGMELWSVKKGSDTKIVLVDRSSDKRFTADVATWNGAVAGLNAATMKKVKDAASANHTVTQ